MGLGAYLRSRWRGTALYLFCAGASFAVWRLYGLPWEPLFYVWALCTAAALPCLVRDAARCLGRSRELELLRRNIRASIERLPEPRGPVEAGYDSLLRELWDEKARLEAEYSAARREAEDYYAMWVHQIKTPIAALRLLLQREPRSDTAALRAELFRIEQYVEMVLSYQRLGAGTVDLVLRRTELDSVVRSCVRKYAPLFIAKKLPLELEETGLEAVTDEKWLAFVIEQLLSNALKYTEKGGIRILAEGRSLVIEDSGAGIAPEDLPSLGERGFTGYNGRAEHGSTGLGLYLCRRICGLLGHGLRFESELGRGTRAILSFPEYRLEAE